MGESAKRRNNCKEIMPKLSSHRSEVFDYFYNKYNVVPDENFRETEFESEVPAEILKKQPLMNVSTGYLWA